MDGVTDHPFRVITKKYGQPDLMYTEFVNVEGICKSGKPFLLRALYFREEERPLIAQIYGKTPEFFYEVSILLCYLGFDGIDINMGCPSKNVASSGGGAALIKTPDLAVKIIQACQQASQDFANGFKLEDLAYISGAIKKEIKNKNPQRIRLPISVKTRIGFDKIITENWIQILLNTKPDAIAVHGRTLRQQYSGLANWEEIGKAAQLAKAAQVTFLGNGDIKSRAEALEKIEKYDLDGVLIGRATWGNPLVFKNISRTTCRAANKKQVKIALEHARLFESFYQQYDKYSFLPMRKHLAWYIKGVDNAAQIRSELVRTNNSQEVEEVFRKYGLF